MPLNIGNVTDDKGWLVKIRQLGKLEVSLARQTNVLFQSVCVIFSPDCMVVFKNMAGNHKG